MPITIPMHGADDAEIDTRGSGHDVALLVTFRGVTVTITLRSEEYASISGTSPDTVLVMVDEEEDGPLSVQMNDSDLFERDADGTRRYALDDGVLRVQS